MTVACLIDNYTPGRLLPTRLYSAARMVYLDQRWFMFAPEPNRLSRRARVTGVQVDGGRVRISLPGIRWVNYFWRFAELRPAPRYKSALARLGPALCGYWNKSHRDIERLASVRVDLHFARIHDTVNEPLPTQRVVDHSCE